VSLFTKHSVSQEYCPNEDSTKQSKSSCLLDETSSEVGIFINAFYYAHYIVESDVYVFAQLPTYTMRDYYDLILHDNQHMG